MKNYFITIGIILLTLIVVLAIFGKIPALQTKKIASEAVTMATPLIATYIPKDIEDCLITLERDKKRPEDILIKFKNFPEEALLENYSQSIADLQNYFQLKSGSRLAIYFNELGISDPNHMAIIILISFHRYLNNKDIRFKEQIAFYKTYR